VLSFSWNKTGPHADKRETAEWSQSPRITKNLKTRGSTRPNKSTRLPTAFASGCGPLCARLDVWDFRYPQMDGKPTRSYRRTREIACQSRCSSIERCKGRPTSQTWASLTAAAHHHLRFAQPRALGRRVSDEYTVPVCRPHPANCTATAMQASWWQRSASTRRRPRSAFESARVKASLSEHAPSLIFRLRVLGDRTATGRVTLR
jgi:hypothetical protein